ncbi:hypothetical protein GCM10023185_17840 [Hymenobacter saemangeumensis]|uniref:Uncharacterized protein n=2 Tax=Hymenobacter saemangeumensis TaxID=1084522 RepID=A0ABP8IBH1_9BACT
MASMYAAQPLNTGRLRIGSTLIISVLILGLLLWNHFHGGVPSHHILQQKDLPSISNWWGAIVLPALTWILVGRTIARIEKRGALSWPGHKAVLVKPMLLFISGLTLGVLIAIAFTFNYTPFLDNIPYLILLLSLVVPIFFSEFILGFIIGMTYTFGVILPMVFILVLAAIGFAVYTFIRPLLIKFLKLFDKHPSTTPGS